MILGLIDIEANYLVIKAYQYTTLTSVQVSLLSSITCEPIGVRVCAQGCVGACVGTSLSLDVPLTGRWTDIRQ